MIPSSLPRNEMTTKAEQPIGAAMSDHHAHFPSRSITLSGRLVTIVPVSGKYADGLWPLVSGEGNTQLWTYMANHQKMSLEALRDYMDQGASPHADQVNFVILLNDTGSRESGHPVGMVSFMRIDPVNRIIEIGNVFFTAPLQRTPAATEVQYLLLKFAFENLDNRRVEWKCDSLNVPSQCAALRLGFKFEGLFRQHRIYKGRTRDTMWYSMLKDEWEGGYRTSFEDWLDEKNFDENGKQRTRLEECRRNVLAKFTKNQKELGGDLE